MALKKEKLILYIHTELFFIFSMYSFFTFFRCCIFTVELSNEIDRCDRIYVPKAKYILTVIDVIFSELHFCCTKNMRMCVSVCMGTDLCYTNPYMTLFINVKSKKKVYHRSCFKRH